MTSPAEVAMYDSMLMNLAQRHGGIDPLMDTFFGFLRRKTDFFTGASSERAEELVLTCLRRQAELARRDSKDVAAKATAAASVTKKKKPKKKKKAKKASKPKEAAAAPAAAAPAPVAAAPAPVAEESRIVELPDDEEEAAAAVEATAATVEEMEAAASADAVELESVEESDGPEEGKFMPSAGNGGETERYVWTQTLGELTVTFLLPEGCRSRDLTVAYTPTKLSVRVRGEEAARVDGRWQHRINSDESYWVLEEGSLVFYIEKDNKMQWWSTVIDGDAEIDTKKVQPENSKLSDLDSDTRATVEKMMEKQRRQAAGLPSIEEEARAGMLKKFMAAHPEMDFSGAKISGMDGTSVADLMGSS